MDRVLQLIADYQWWIYGILGIILVFFVRRALMARREGARSIFKLEQEQARVRYTRSVALSAVVLILIAAVFVLGNPVLPSPEPTTPEPALTETTGPLVASTLTPTPPPATATSTPTATVVRPTRPRPNTPTPEGDGTPTPIVRPATCPDPNVRITSPGQNQVIQGNFAIRGTANHGEFQYYKVEVGQGRDPGGWTVVGQLHYTAVSGGVLETFNASAYAPGTYTLRLVVVDQTGNYPQPCRVTITVQR
ncbi:MAG: hypothetical protein PVF47_00305 [Anaerolineae bacterium]|jgi:hypothetical protein